MQTNLLSGDGTLHESFVDQPVVNEPEEGEAVEDDTVEDDTVEDEPMEDEPMEDDTVEDKPVEDKPVENAPVENVPVEDEPVENAPVEDELLVDGVPVYEISSESTPPPQEEIGHDENNLGERAFSVIPTAANVEPASVRYLSPKYSQGEWIMMK